MGTIKVTRGQYTGYQAILKAAGVYDVDANIAMNGFDITELDDLNFNEAGQNLLSDTSGLHLAVPTGDVFDILVNGVTTATFSNTGVDFQNTDLSNIDDISTNAAQALNSDTSGWTLNVPTGDYFQITVNSVNKGKFDVNGLNMQSNYIDNIDKLISANATDDLIDFLASSISYEVGSGDLHQFKVNGTVEVVIQADEVNVKNNYIQLDERTAPSGTANAGRLYCVDNGSGKTSLRVIFGSGAAQTIATEP